MTIYNLLVMIDLTVIFYSIKSGLNLYYNATLFFPAFSISGPFIYLCLIYFANYIQHLVLFSVSR